MWKLPNFLLIYTKLFLFAVAGTWTSMTELCQPDTLYLLCTSSMIIYFHLTTAHMHSIKLKYYEIVMQMSLGICLPERTTHFLSQKLVSYMICLNLIFAITEKSQEMLYIKPPNKGHIGDRPFVPCRRGCPLLEDFFQIYWEVLKDV